MRGEVLDDVRVHARAERGRIATRRVRQDQGVDERGRQAKQRRTRFAQESFEARCRVGRVGLEPRHRRRHRHALQIAVRDAADRRGGQRHQRDRHQR